MIPQRGLLGNKTWRETQIDLEVYELNVDLILTAKRFSPIAVMSLILHSVRGRRRHERVGGTAAL